MVCGGRVCVCTYHIWVEKSFFAINVIEGFMPSILHVYVKCDWWNRRAFFPSCGHRLFMKFAQIIFSLFGISFTGYSHDNFWFNLFWEITRAKYIHTIRKPLNHRHSTYIRWNFAFTCTHITHSHNWRSENDQEVCTVSSSDIIIFLSRWRSRVVGNMPSVYIPSHLISISVTAISSFRITAVSHPCSPASLHFAFYFPFPTFRPYFSSSHINTSLSLLLFSCTHRWLSSHLLYA